MELATTHRVHHNNTQLLFEVVRPRVGVIIGSRGIGKTEGIAGPWVAHNVFAMPRSVGAIIAPSYADLLGRTVMSLYDGFEAMGYIKDRDYVVGKRGPAHWPLPHKKIEAWNHAMHWRCGSACVFISQDGKGAGNALSTDYHLLDEAKLLDADSYLNSTAATLRGNRAWFGHQSEWQSVLVLTDRPTTAEEKWVYRWKDEMNPDCIRAILELCVERQFLEERIATGGLADNSIATYSSKISEIDAALNEIRKSTTLYHEANILENIDVIGVDGLRNLASLIKDPRKFDASVLNEEVDIVEKAFYAGLIDEAHGYIPTPSSVAHKGPGGAPLVDCRMDTMLHPNVPLDIALDYGLFTCLVVGQLIGPRFNVDNALHVDHPLLLADLLANFIDHYRPHVEKTVIYHHDHTTIARDSKSPDSYRDIVVKALRAAGWNVIPNYIKHTSPPEERYEMWAAQFTRKATGIVVWFNRTNCKHLLRSMHLTKTKQEIKGFSKDKSPERNPKVDQVEAPHLGDSVDTLLDGRQQLRQRGPSSPVTSMFA